MKSQVSERPDFIPFPPLVALENSFNVRSVSVITYNMGIIVPTPFNDCNEQCT